MGFSAPPPPPNGHFLPKNGLKTRILATSSIFWALVVTPSAPHPILQVPDSTKDVLQGMGAQKWVFQPPPPPPKKMVFFAQKWPNNAILGHKQCFVGSGGRC